MIKRWVINIIEGTSTWTFTWSTFFDVQKQTYVATDDVTRMESDESEDHVSIKWLASILQVDLS